jgi:hypothetical protein
VSSACHHFPETMLRSRPSTKEDRSTSASTRPAPADETGPARALACALCRSRVTSDAARIEIAGRHEHSCENPHGYHYRIGCFAVAEGLVAASEPTHAYTWFPGYTWQVMSCAACRHHLGWRFASGDGGFYGLILDHLVRLPL